MGCKSSRGDLVFEKAMECRLKVTKVHQVEEAAKAAQIELTVDEISQLERLGYETGVHTPRKWEKEM